MFKPEILPRQHVPLPLSPQGTLAQKSLWTAAKCYPDKRYGFFEVLQPKNTPSGQKWLQRRRGADLIFRFYADPYWR